MLIESYKYISTANEEDMNKNNLSYQLYILLLQTLFTIVDNSTNVRCSFLIFASIVHKSIGNSMK